MHDIYYHVFNVGILLWLINVFIVFLVFITYNFILLHILLVLVPFVVLIIFLFLLLFPYTKKKKNYIWSVTKSQILRYLILIFIYFFKFCFGVSSYFFFHLFPYTRHDYLFMISSTTNFKVFHFIFIIFFFFALVSLPISIFILLPVITIQDTNILSFWPTAETLAMYLIQFFGAPCLLISTSIFSLAIIIHCSNIFFPSIQGIQQ